MALGRRDREFDALMLVHLDAVYDVALRLSGRRHEAQDLTQETFLRAFSAFARFERGTCARAWLFTILRNCHRNRLRDAARHPHELIEEDMVVAPTEAEPANWEAVSSEDLDAAVQMLALHYREVIILRDLQGLNYRDISAMLDLPMGTVMSRLHRARTELKKTLVWRLRGQRSRRAR